MTEERLAELVEIYPEFILTLDNPSIGLQLVAVAKEPLIVTKLNTNDPLVFKTALFNADEEAIINILSMPKRIEISDNLLAHIILINPESIFYVDPALITKAAIKSALTINPTIIGKFPRKWITPNTLKLLFNLFGYQTYQICPYLRNCRFSLTDDEVYDLIDDFKENNDDATEVKYLLQTLTNKILKEKEVERELERKGVEEDEF